MKNNIDLLVYKLELLGIQINDRQIQQLIMFYEMLIETNKVMNLTSITEPREVIDKHFADSLAICKIYNLNRRISVIDVGTGAGFPGIPIKIVFPDVDIVLLDSLNKRVKFLEGIVRTLGLKNVSCIHGRSEDIARNEQYREKFDLCVSRAVANLSTLSELCMPFVKTGGSFISYKAGNCQDEIAEAREAVRMLGGKIEEKDVLRFLLPETELERVFVEIKKIKSTGKKYPRRAGIPAREPLGKTKN